MIWLAYAAAYLAAAGITARYFRWRSARSMYAQLAKKTPEHVSTHSEYRTRFPYDYCSVCDARHTYRENQVPDVVYGCIWPILGLIWLSRMVMLGGVDKLPSPERKAYELRQREADIQRRERELGITP